MLWPLAEQSMSELPVQVEALRPLGLQLLGGVLARFGAAEDPLLHGHALLEQFQAQYVSALRCAWAFATFIYY